MTLAGLFRQHVAQRQKTTEQALKECRIDGLVIGAGGLSYYPEDDMAVPYRPYHHFAHWCPHPGENHMLLIRPGQKPVLSLYFPEDYWHERTELSDTFWTSEFDIRVFASEDDVWKSLPSGQPLAYLGPDTKKAQAAGLKTEVPALLARLNWERSFKSEYEIKCIERASRKAAKGHVAAREAFFAGGSELDIHHAFMRAIRATSEHLPYESIVCLNEKCAVLHYHKKRDKVRLGASFLIDAGAQYKGYSSDITRSYATEKAHPVFRALLGGMSGLQQGLAAAIKPGLSFEHLHGQAHLELARLLVEHGLLVGVNPEQAFERDLTLPFFPHGLGHMLGIFTHDVAGKQADRAGTALVQTQKAKFRHLRTGRILDAGNVLTVEPGLYFIEMLLSPQRIGPNRSAFNWDLIDSLKPFGGIRIEDDVLVTRSGHRNFTREFLP